MANNKFVLKDGTVLLDLTADTVTANKILQGYTAHDASGATITGTYQGGGSGYVESGLIYQNSSEGKLTATNDTISEETLTNCTLEVCYNVTAVQGYGGIIGAALIALNENLLLNVDQAATGADYGLQVYYGNEYSATALIPVSGITFGTTRHTYTVAQSGARTNVYFDGSLVGGYDNFNGRTTITGTQISFNHNVNPMTGKCYNIRVYNRALSAAEIALNRAEDVTRYGT